MAGPNNAFSISIPLISDIILQNLEIIFSNIKLNITPISKED